MRPLFGLAAALLGGAAVLGLFGLLTRPDVTTPPAPPPEAELARVRESRRLAERLDLRHPPVIAQAVDYSAGPAALWYPRTEAPVLADLVRAGRLPPVAERVGSEPVVLRGVDGAASYGGDWRRLANSFDDLKTVAWRLSGSTLVRWSPQGYPLVPHLAKGWKVSADQRVYTFSLRRGVRWSDGHPLTSADILYWYEHEVLHFNAYPKFLRAGPGLGTVSAPDPWSVRFEFSQPNPLFLERLASTGLNHEDYSEYVLPAHYLRPYHPAVGDPALIRGAMAALGLSSPVAVYRHLRHHLNPAHPRLWPWILHAPKPNGPQAFVRNPYYWAVDPEGRQLPYLDRLVFDLRSNPLIALAAANGEPSMQDRHIRYEDHTLLVGGAARNGYEVLHWKPSTQSVFTLFPNLNRRVDPERPETAWKHRLLNEARFRQALSLAINRRDIIAAHYNGQGSPAQISPPADSPYHHPRLQAAFTAYDPAGANRRLDALGLTARDADGFRTFPDGSRMLFTLNLTDYTSEGPAHFVVADWAKVGVRAIVRVRARRLFEQEKLTYQHDFTVWTGESEFYPLVEPRNFVPTYFESFYAPAFGWWYQYGGLHGAATSRRPNAQEPPPGHPLRRAMELLEAAGGRPDEAGRIALFREIGDLAAEHLWTISIATPPPQLVVVRNGFRNVPRTALFGANLQSPANAGLETYCWEEPPPVVASTEALREEIMTVSPSGALAALGRPPPRGPGWPGVITLVTLGLLAFIGWRHRWIGRRLLLMVPTLAAVSMIVFFLVQLPPGDFAQLRVARLSLEGTPASEELVAELRRVYHLDRPAWERYAHWMGLRWFVTFEPADAGVLQGHPGMSMEHDKPAAEVIGDRIVLTLLVTGATLAFTWLLALPLGVYSAVRRGSVGEHVVTFLAFLGMSVPGFLLALVVMSLATRWFGLDGGGLFSPQFALAADWSWGKAMDLARHLWLPVLVLGFGSAAGMMRVMRANLLDELRQPYVTTARAKGLRPWQVLWRYPVRLALGPFVSGLGSLIPQLVSGGAIVAMVLSLPMLGPTLLDALIAEDVYLAASLLLLLSVLGSVGTLLSDLLLLWLDPRIRLGSGNR